MVNPRYSWGTQKKKKKKKKKKTAFDLHSYLGVGIKVCVCVNHALTLTRRCSGVHGRLIKKRTVVICVTGIYVSYHRIAKG